ncbi:MAG TPA: 4-hydroxy-tetrahydrodipicolinate reductase [Vicinamibacterales bacterium]
MNILLIGYGRMGRLVESLAHEYGATVVGHVDRSNAASEWPEADVAIDFSTADAVATTLARLAERGTNVVIGTTGWRAQEADMRRLAQRIGVVGAPNFAIGVNLFALLVERAGELFKDHPSFGTWIHELHHAAKKDAPSGTALQLEVALRTGGLDRAIDIASTRAGSIPGTHTVGFDSPAETITLTHAARDRSGFARGALEAARWVQGKRGWFGMADVLGGRRRATL